MTTTARPACGVALLLLSLSIRAWAWALPHQRSFALSKSRLGARMLPIDEPKKSSAQVADEIDRAERFIKFLDVSPEPFHVVAEVARQLEDAGFVKLSERERWAANGLVRPGGKYYYVKAGSSIVAFAVGAAVEPGRHGFKVIGAHTDSPALKVKPRSQKSATSSPGDVTQLSVETYGGGLWHTWFDRDLSIAGRAIVQVPGSNNKSPPTFEKRLVNLKAPILKVPTLCIHLQSAAEREAFQVNKEDHLPPLLCSAAKTALAGDKDKKDEGQDEDQEANAWAAGQEPELLNLVAEELKCDVKDVVDFELTLFDTQTAALGGARRDFVNGARLDNLASCFVSLEALVEHCTASSSSEEGEDQEEPALSYDTDVSVIALFDHEEVGSGSAAGAGSPIMRDAVERITHALLSIPNANTAAAAAKNNDNNKESSSKSLSVAATEKEASLTSLEKSFILSADMAHAVHPNYAAKHEKQHAPKMNGGPVLKSNSNQRYATAGATSFLVREVARRAGVPLQEFAVRNDCPCGSTIGPQIAANTGVRAVDVGMPQLSMHSCREMMGRADLSLGHKFFVAFFKHFREVDDALAE